MDYELLYEKLKEKNKNVYFKKYKYCQFIKRLKLEFYNVRRLKAYLLKNGLDFEQLLVVLNILRIYTQEETNCRNCDIFISILRKYLTNKDTKIKTILSFLKTLYDGLTIVSTIVNKNHTDSFIFSTITVAMFVYDKDNHMSTHRHICRINDKYIPMHRGIYPITCSLDCNYQIPYSDKEIINVYSEMIRYCIYELKIKLSYFGYCEVNRFNFYLNTTYGDDEFNKNNENVKKQIKNILYYETESVNDFGSCLVDIIMMYV